VLAAGHHLDDGAGQQRTRAFGPRQPNAGLSTSFTEHVARRDKGLLLPDRRPVKRLSKINVFPTTDGHRRPHAKPANKPKPFAPTVPQVKQIVPQKLTPKFKP
jgi:hypothetical protein